MKQTNLRAQAKAAVDKNSKLSDKPKTISAVYFLLIPRRISLTTLVAMRAVHKKNHVKTNVCLKFPEDSLFPSIEDAYQDR